MPISLPKFKAEHYGFTSAIDATGHFINDGNEQLTPCFAREEDSDTEQDKIPIVKSISREYEELDIFFEQPLVD